MKDPKKRIFTVPNVLSLFRIVIGLLIFNTIESWNDILLWGALAAIFDFFDGGYARKYKVVTYLGEILDPAGDKLLVVAVLWRINHELALVVGFLEIAATVFAYLFRYGNKDSHIVASGSKPITALQMLCLLAFALNKLGVISFSDPRIYQLYGLMMGLSVSRACMYASCFWGKLKQKKKKERSELETKSNIAA